MTTFVEILMPDGRGPRLAIKDCIDVAGIPTRCGSRAMDNKAAAVRDAEVVRRLRDAGCTLVGKTSMHELAFGVTGINDWAGTPVNPADSSRIPGGSSSGSAAAVGSGAADIALGTDTGGSIRVPAACCGVTGLKPSFGLVSRDGVFPPLSTLDCVGPLARDMDGIIFAMKALDTHFGEVSAFPVRVGRIRLSTHPEIANAIDTVLTQSGAPLESLDLPGLKSAFEAGIAIIAHENFSAFGHLLHTGLLGADVAARLAGGMSIDRNQLIHAEAIRSAFRREVNRLFNQVDILALPTMPDFPPLMDDVRHDRSAIALTAYVRPFNLTGHPALSIPIATDSGLPGALQLVGRHGEDSLLCAFGKRLEMLSI